MTSFHQAATTSPETTTQESHGLFQAYQRVKRIGYLTHEEIQRAVKKARAIHPDKSLQFIEINHVEPDKAKLLESLHSIDDAELPRIAEVISMSLATNETLVDYVRVDQVGDESDGDGVVKSVVLPDVQAGLSPDEYAFVEALCKVYQPLLDAIAKRGLDPEYLVADAWCIGHSGPDCDPTERLCWPSLYYCDPKHDDLPYARPIEGIDVRISLTHKKVVSFEDQAFGIFPIPGSNDAKSHYYTKEKQRTGLKPICITQPEGPSWQISNTNYVSWQKWSMQVGFNSREGCTLHGICYDGRPILHRLSICEMVVPYGDPRDPHALKNAFDAGEDGLGRNANSLLLGCDCVGLIHYFDVNMVKDNGDPFLLKHGICLHEEDAGIAWKHTDWRTGIPKLARNRRLVVSFICTIANYEYGFYYYFYLDGNIEIDVKLTGVLSTGAYSYEEQAEGRKYGIPLGGSLYAPVHQHFFVGRMNFAIEGRKNTVYEWNAQVDDAGPHNPTRNGFFFTSTPITKDGCRHCNSDSARFWTICNEQVTNSIGQAVAYKLSPSTNIKPFAPLAQASRLKRAQFLDHQLWVTAYDEAERYPAGDFVNQMPHLDGLPVWIQKNRPVQNADIVVWHVFGVTHCPRPEEWPIMPVEHCGYHLKPFNFFDHSPSLDIPPGGTCGNIKNGEGVAKNGEHIARNGEHVARNGEHVAKNGEHVARNGESNHHACLHASSCHDA